MIENFCKDEEEAVAKLREILSGKSPCTLEDFNHLKKKMLDRPKERERMLSKMLKNFHCDQEALAAGLRKLLEKGPEVRIKDFKALIRAFHIEQMNESSGVDEILEEFDLMRGYNEKTVNLHSLENKLYVVNLIIEDQQPLSIKIVK